MPYVFSTTIDGVNLHIRMNPNPLYRETLLNERPHKHFYIEFHYVYQGEEVLLFHKEKKEVHLTARQIALIPCQVYHCAKTDQSRNVTRFCFNFSIEAEDGKDNAIYQIFQNIKEVTVFESDFISSTLNRYRKIVADEKDPMQETRGGLLLLDVILEIFRTLSEGMNFPVHSQNKVRQKWLIEEHIWSRFYTSEGLEGLAKKLYLSPRQTRKLVKQFYGEDYKTLIVRQRMETAELLLQSRDLALEEIAEKVGYRSYSGFHLAFVRTFQITPGEYRENLRKKSRT